MPTVETIEGADVEYLLRPDGRHLAVLVDLISKWRASVGQWLALAGDQGAGGSFDDVVDDGVELDNSQDTADLREEAFEEAEVAAGDAFDRGDGLGVGEVPRNLPNRLPKENKPCEPSPSTLTSSPCTRSTCPSRSSARRIC